MLTQVNQNDIILIFSNLKQCYFNLKKSNYALTKLIGHELTSRVDQINFKLSFFYTQPKLGLISVVYMSYEYTLN